MIVREERLSDISAIREVVTAAFGRADEATLVEGLRDAGDTVLSMVAVDDGRVVGHIALSKMLAPFPALALAPISVLPAMQRCGIGSALIRESIERSRQDWSALFALGDPRFYTRFGFDVGLAAGYDSPYAGSHFMVLPLDGRPLIAAGTLSHAPAFKLLT